MIGLCYQKYGTVQVAICKKRGRLSRSSKNGPENVLDR